MLGFSEQPLDEETEEDELPKFWHPKSVNNVQYKIKCFILMLR
jgi:hypothetical protein